jgi:hypothetical protein
MVIFGLGLNLNHNFFIILSSDEITLWRVTPELKYEFRWLEIIFKKSWDPCKAIDALHGLALT